jgi:hypothetical protein
VIEDPTDGSQDPSLDPDRWIRHGIYAGVALVAAFAFIVSYSHIYDLGRQHAEFGIADRLLPLSVDLLIVAATLVLWLQSRSGAELAGLERKLPRGTLWGGIGATVAANIAYGLPHGWLASVISAWPGAAFVAAVELAIVAVKAGRYGLRPGESPQATPVPPDSVAAAKAAYDATLLAGNPLSRNQLTERFGITRAQADEIREPAVSAALNGDSPA